MRWPFTLLLALPTLGSVHAQIGLGAQFTYMKYGSGGGGFPSMGINASYVVKEAVPVRFSFTYSFPKTESVSYEASALSSVTDPSRITVTGKEKIGLMHFWLDGQKFFGNGDYSGGFYGALGLGLTIANYEEDYNAYDQTLYDGPDDASGSVSQWLVRAGLGYETGIGFANLFMEAGLNLSANSANGQEIAVNLPSNFYGTAGLRHWLGESHDGGGGSKGKGKKKKKKKKKSHRRH